MGLPVSETWPRHVIDMLRHCKDCENENPCEFFRGVVEQGGEQDKSGLDDSSCYTSGIAMTRATVALQEARQSQIISP